MTKDDLFERLKLRTIELDQVLLDNDALIANVQNLKKLVIELYDLVEFDTSNDLRERVLKALNV